MTWFILSVLSAIFYMLLWVFTRMSRGMSPWIVMIAEHFYGPFLLLWFIRTVEFPWDQMWWWAYLALPFFALPLAGYLITIALHETEVTVVKPLFGLSSFATLAVASLFFGETFSSMGIAGLAVITLGLLCLYHGRWNVWKKRGPWISLFGAFVFGGNAAVVAVVLQHIPNVLAMSAIVMTGPFLVSLIPASKAALHMDWNRRVILICLGLMLSMLIQDVVTLIALQMGPSPYVIAIKRTSVLLTAVVGYIFLHERNQSLTRLLLSSSLVVGGVVLLTLS